MRNLYSRLINPLAYLSDRGLDLLVYRLLFTLLPFFVSLFGKFNLSPSEFIDLQMYLVYVVSYSSFISLGFYSTFQYISARKMLSLRLFKYLAGYFTFLSILYIIVLLCFRDILNFPNWILGFIILIYFYNDSINFSFYGQRKYKLYYFITSNRYFLYLCIVFSKVFSDKYHILFIFEFLLFLLLTINYLKNYLNVRSFGIEKELILSNVIPSLSSTLGVKSFLMFSTFFLFENQIADIKFIIAFFGLINIIPQVLISDYVNKIIAIQDFKFSLKSIKMYFIAFFIISQVFSVILYLIDSCYFDLGSFIFFDFILLGLLNWLIQITASCNQFFFASRIQYLRYFGDFIFAFSLFFMSYFSSKLSGTVFISYASFASTISLFFILSKYRKIMRHRNFSINK